MCSDALHCVFHAVSNPPSPLFCDKYHCSVSPTQTLYTYPDSFRAAKALIAAQYSGASVKVVSEPPEFVLGQTNKTQEFLDSFPLGKVSSSNF